MIILNIKTTLFSKIRYICNGLILRSLPTSYSKSYLQYLRIKKEDNVYKYLLSKKPTCKLTKEQYEEIDAYWSRFYKVRPDSHVFYFLSTGNYSKEYVPYSIWRYIIDPYFNDWKRAHYFDNKCYYHRIMPNIFMPALYAYKLNNLWYNSHDEVITLDEVLRIVMSKSDCFIKEAVESWGGLGVKYFSPSSQSKEELEEIFNNMRGDVVIQEGVRQCAVLSKINSDSVNTLRIISFLTREGSVKILSTVLRMGIRGSKVDNITSGGLSIGVQEDGRLKDVAYNNRGEKFTEHPTSHVCFGDIVVPNLDVVKEIVRNNVPKFPHFRLISWDFAINEQLQPVLIEANFCDGDLDLHQLNNGPIFGDETESILSEIFS